MNTLQLTILCITVLLLAAGYLYVRSQERRGRARAEDAHSELLRQIGDSLENALAYAEARAPGPLLTGKKVVVTGRDGASVEGIVAADYPDKVVLRSAVFFKPGGDRTPAGGTIEVPRPVSHIQISSRQEA